MSNCFFHRGIPVMPEKATFTSPGENRTSQRMAIYSPLPGKKPATPARRVMREPAVHSAFEWLPHCSQRLKRLTRRAKASAPRSLRVPALS
ncbi:hypothetical protein [Jiella mangrovi]|uniref:Uncharacterized protein n=1 Tax=Jiella mangrovi TaxID=2821407 RepID=A0ABS4BKP7_9HYPH|nr:hypothetical protein [Jiella mangrovi]MBP0617288.1 hypothetical protein [Jiella mangrovi]